MQRCSLVARWVNLWVESSSWRSWSWWRLAVRRQGVFRRRNGPVCATGYHHPKGAAGERGFSANTARDDSQCPVLCAAAQQVLLYFSSACASRYLAADERSPGSATLLLVASVVKFVGSRIRPGCGKEKKKTNQNREGKTGEPRHAQFGKASMQQPTPTGRGRPIRAAHHQQRHGPTAVVSRCIVISYGEREQARSEGHMHSRGRGPVRATQCSRWLQLPVGRASLILGGGLQGG